MVRKFTLCVVSLVNGPSGMDKNPRGKMGLVSVIGFGQNDILYVVLSSSGTPES